MGVFDILPGLGGDGEAGDAEPPDDSGGSGGDAGDQISLAELGPGDFRERAEALAARSDVPRLDFTVDSLDRLDELAAGPPSAVDDEVAYGSFLGEIIVHEYGGEWTDEDGWQVAVDLPDGETTVAVFEAAEMSIAEDPVFVKVVDHLEAQGAERTPDVSDEPATDTGAEAVDADQEPSAEPDDEELGEADAVDDPTEPADGEPADADDTDTVVVDDPVTEPDGPGSDDGIEADEATDGVATDAGVSADRDGVSGGDGASAASGVATDAEEPGDDDPSTGRPSDADAVDDPGPAPHRPADSEVTDSDLDPDAESGEEPSDPAPADAAATAEADGEDASDEEDSGEDASDEEDSGEDASDEEDSGEDDAGADSGLLSSGVLPFGGGNDGADDADATDAGADSGAGSESDEGDGDAVPEPTDEAPTADRDDAGPAAATPVDAAADDADDAPDDDAPDDDAPDDDTAEGDEAADDSADPAPFVPDSADTGYSPTEYSPDDSGPDTDGDDESAVADESDGAVDDHPTMSISEQIAALGDDVAQPTDVDDGPDTDDANAASGSDPQETGQADDGAVDDGSGGEADVDAPDDADEAPADDSGGTTGADTAAPERYVLRRTAEELVDGWPERGLDFTAESLPRLDAFVDEQWDGRFRARSLENRTVHHEESGDPLVQLGAYYGEVLIRWLDGEWVATDDGEGAIEVPDVGERVERVDVFGVARECLVPPSTFAYRYDALVNRLHVDEPAASDGRADVFDDDRGTLTSGDVITQFAATAESVVEEWEKYPLDYSPRSVRALEEIVDRVTRGVELADVPLADGTDPESLWLTARATSLGAYFAAVLLRHRDAQWRIDGDDVELVIDRPDGERTVDPVATAAAALRGEGSFVDTYTALDD